jgi:hypothetical protein
VSSTHPAWLKAVPPGKSRAAGSSFQIVLVAYQ